MKQLRHLYQKLPHTSRGILIFAVLLFLTTLVALSSRFSLSVDGIRIDQLVSSIQDSWDCESTYVKQEHYLNRDTDRLYAFDCDRIPSTSDSIHSKFAESASNWTSGSLLNESGLVSPVQDDPSSSFDEEWETVRLSMICRYVAEGGETAIVEFATVCIESNLEPSRVFLRVVSL